MKSKVSSTVVALVPALVLVLTCLLAGIGSGFSRTALAATSDTLTVADVEPESAPNDLDTPIVISGTGFAVLSDTLAITSPVAYVGDTALKDVTWVDSATLTASVPWGLQAGVYDVKVVNPDGEMGALSGAFTVTQGIGVWTSGGPYGGVIGHVVLHPITPTEVYATAESSGLFHSTDGGEHWKPLLIEPIGKRLAIDPHQPEVMYIGDLRSQDGGTTWESMMPPQVPTHEHAYESEALAHPTISGTVYLAVSGYSEQGCGLYESGDRGQTWTATLTNTRVTSIAFHPTDPDIMALATSEGDVYRSSDGGANWAFAAHVSSSDFVKRVYINPFGAHEVWFLDEDCCSRVFRSTDSSLTHWEPITIELNRQVNSLTFHPTIPGTVWAGSGAGYVSTDGGQTWQSAGTGLYPGGTYTHGVKNFAVDATTDPANPILYAGSGRGVYRSTDGGSSWAETNEGLAGIEVWRLAVSPHDPDELYASTASRGALWSGNGGGSWQELDMPQSGWHADLAVDPFVPTRVYFTGEEGSGEIIVPVVRVSDDRGESWTTVPLSIPHELEGWSGRTYALAPHPTEPGRLLAGIGLYPPEWHGWVGPQGGIYLSEDYGEHWEMIQPSEPISQVAVIAYDPVDPQIVYAGTRGGTLLKSYDSGTTWQLIYTWSGIPDIVTIAVNPTNHDMVLAGLMESARGIPGGENGIFISTDGGSTWEEIGPWVWTLAYDAHDPPFVYGGTYGDGLQRSDDNGLHWETVSSLSEGNIESLSTATDGKRVIVYVGLSGGAMGGEGLSSQGLSEAMSGSAFLGSGVFRITMVIPRRLYLPAVSTLHAP